VSGSAPGAPYEYAIARLQAAGGDVAALALELQTLLLVESAQSIIDNGGLEFFYEADFPNNPPYSDFVAAYRRIGADGAADCIEASALLFPFDQPQHFEPLRQLWLERFRQEPQHVFARLSAQVCGDASVWAKLRLYVRAHGDAFTGP
jgi:hypothetical protein